MCRVVAYRVLPDCATKEGMNVFSKLDDECAEEKTEIMRMMNLDKASSGKDIFRSCKDIAAKGFLKQFKEMQGLVSGLCSEWQDILHIRHHTGGNAEMFWRRRKL